MMFPSHLAATVLLGMLLAKVRPFGAKEWLFALGFGVVIDLDHLFQLPRYAATHGGVSAFADVRSIVTWGADWQGFLHSPWAAILVLAFSVAAGSFVPFVFWGLHMVLDFVVARHFVPFGGGLELAILAAMAGAILAVVAWDGRSAPHGVPRYVRDRTVTAVLALLAAVRR